MSNYSTEGIWLFQLNPYTPMEDTTLTFHARSNDFTRNHPIEGIWLSPLESIHPYMEVTTLTSHTSSHYFTSEHSLEGIWLFHLKSMNHYGRPLSCFQHKNLIAYCSCLARATGGIISIWLNSHSLYGRLKGIQSFSIEIVQT